LLSSRKATAPATGWCAPWAESSRCDMRSGLLARSSPTSRSNRRRPGPNCPVTVLVCPFAGFDQGAPALPIKVPPTHRGAGDRKPREAESQPLIRELTLRLWVRRTTSRPTTSTTSQASRSSRFRPGSPPIGTSQPTLRATRSEDAPVAHQVRLVDRRKPRRRLGPTSRWTRRRSPWRPGRERSQERSPDTPWPGSSALVVHRRAAHTLVVRVVNWFPFGGAGY